jgi:hypothetical protein
MNCDFVAGDFLFHVIHGLCRVNEVSKSADKEGKETVYYAVVPHVSRSGNQRFSFAANDLAVSGFHPPVSVDEAGKILKFLSKRHIVDITEESKRKAFHPDETLTWELAKSLLSCAHDAIAAKDQRRRRVLERSAKGLILEMAHVLQIPVREAIRQVRQSLECTQKVGPLVLAALNNAVED